MKDYFVLHRVTLLIPAAVIATMLPEEEYENGHILISKSVKKLMDAGVKVNMGAHGQIHGLGAHWEIWMMQQGGMTNHQALQTATINPAISLGLDKWIGSLEAGKLADLIVMDKNPLENIRNTESIRYTMVNGRLYDAAQMNEIGNYNKPRTKFYWELNKNADSFPWHDRTWMKVKDVLAGSIEKKVKYQDRFLVKDLLIIIRPMTRTLKRPRSIYIDHFFL